MTGGGEEQAAVAADTGAAIQGSIRRHQLALSRLVLLNEAADAIQGAAGRGDLRVLHEMILVATTAGHGLGFHRAFLLLADRRREMLRGELAVGPADADEARGIWSELDRLALDLPGIVEHYRRKRTGDKIDRLVRSFEIPLGGPDHLLLRPWRDRATVHAGPGCPAGPIPEELRRQLGCDSLAAAPLLAGDRVLGVLVGDHAITGAPITGEDVELLRMFAGYAGSALQDAHLHIELESKIHELRRAHEALRASHERIVEMEKLSAVGEMAAKVAHEIRTPLVSIGGFANQVARSLPEGDRNQAPLRIIREEVLRLERIVSEILEFVRPVVRSLQRHDLNELVERAARLLADELGARRAVVVTRLARDLPAVRVNWHQIHQVLQNLIRNAAEAMPHGGHIEIITEAAGGKVRVHVDDDGVGIPQEVRGKILRPFFSTKEAGSGLGLAIASQIVEAHNGRLHFRDREGGGTRFTLELAEDSKFPKETKP